MWMQYSWVFISAEVLFSCYYSYADTYNNNANVQGYSPSENLRTGATMTNKRPCLGFANLRSISVPPRSAIDTGTCICDHKTTSGKLFCKGIELYILFYFILLTIQFVLNI